MAGSKDPVILFALLSPDAGCCTMKNIVICCDGTGNEISENISNVLKLYRVLRKTGKTEPHQVVFYDPGVGTLARPDPWRKLWQDTITIFGLLTGYGLDDNVLASYQFLVQNYRDGDDIYLFGFFVGPLVWGVQMIWIPFWAAGIVNGIGHAVGYRNFNVKDESRNISPIAIWLGGEELHNNHHADPHSAKFKAKWYELDIGWVYLRLLSIFGLAEISYARN